MSLGRIAASRHKVGSGFHGKVPRGVWEVLEESWERPFTLASNFARDFKEEVAVAASLGWISVVSPDGKYLTNRWHITLEGASAWTNEQHSKR